MKKINTWVLGFWVATMIVGCSRQEKVMDGRIGCNATCEVHHVQMDTYIVPIDRGVVIINPTTPYDVLKAKLFPHITKHFESGTCLSDGTDKAQIYVCSQCETANNKWLNDMAKETIDRSNNKKDK